MLILNIDDDLDDREFFCDAVKAIDPAISCIQVSSGDSALDLLKAEKIMPDFIFIDINMPRMNGFECVGEIRSDKKLEHTRIVMYSTAFNPDDMKKYNSLGVTFLIKPGKLIDLVAAIRRLIS